MRRLALSRIGNNQESDWLFSALIRQLDTVHSLVIVDTAIHQWHTLCKSLAQQFSNFLNTLRPEKIIRESERLERGRKTRRRRSNNREANHFGYFLFHLQVAVADHGVRAGTLLKPEVICRSKLRGVERHLSEM